MYTIGEIAKLTGITAYTLRYYEKIGVLPKPRRQDGRADGVRRYDQEDLRFIRFIHGLKMTGMKLEDIAAIAADGCLLSDRVKETDAADTLRKRTAILSRHIEALDRRMQELISVRAAAREKLVYYAEILGSAEAHNR